MALIQPTWHKSSYDKLKFLDPDRAVFICCEDVERDSVDYFPGGVWAQHSQADVYHRVIPTGLSTADLEMLVFQKIGEYLEYIGLQVGSIGSINTDGEYYYNISTGQFAVYCPWHAVPGTTMENYYTFIKRYLPTMVVGSDASVRGGAYGSHWIMPNGWVDCAGFKKAYMITDKIEGFVSRSVGTTNLSYLNLFGTIMWSNYSNGSDITDPDDATIRLYSPMWNGRAIDLGGTPPNVYGIPWMFRTRDAVESVYKTHSDRICGLGITFADTAGTYQEGFFITPSPVVGRWARPCMANGLDGTVASKPRYIGKLGILLER